MTMLTKSKKNRIWTPYGAINNIAKVFKCTRQTVSRSLAGTGKGVNDDKIRHTALTQYGGVEIK